MISVSYSREICIPALSAGNMRVANFNHISIYPKVPSKKSLWDYDILDIIKNVIWPNKLFFKLPFFVKYVGLRSRLWEI